MYYKISLNCKVINFMKGGWVGVRIQGQYFQVKNLFFYEYLFDNLLNDFVCFKANV